MTTFWAYKESRMSLAVIVALIALVFAVAVPALSQLCLGAKIDRPELAYRL